MNTIAVLTPPQGWKLLSQNKQKDFIRKTFGEMDNIISVALPERGDGSVFALLVFRDTGYIDDRSAINERWVQKRLAEEYNIVNHEQEFDAEDIVRWKRFVPKPVYDTTTHCLQYGIELTFGRKPALNLYKIYLLRNGAAVLTLVGTPADHLQLQAWKITPDKQFSYERFDPARDRQAEGNLNNLMLMNPFL